MKEFLNHKHHLVSANRPSEAFFVSLDVAHAAAG
jgi:hypothetical protein